MSDINYSIKSITPQEAAEMLEKSGYQIDHKLPADIEAHKITMLKNGWFLNGDAIILDDNDKVLDGFKRLHACYISKKDLKTVVVNGVNAENKLTIGTHRPRKNSDFLKVLGVKNHTIVATVINSLPSFVDGVYVRRGAVRRPTTAISIHKRYEDRIQNAVDFAKSKNNFTEQPQLIALFHFLLSPIDGSKAEEFLLTSFTEEDKDYLEFDDVRRKLYGRLFLNSDISVPLKKIEKYALIIKAWNTYMKEESVQRLTWFSGKNEPFPPIHGWTRTMDIDTSAESEESDSQKIDPNAYYELDVDLETITPDVAMEYLELNRENNRNLVANSYNRYAHDMKNNDWKLNGQAIKFDENGNLFDGQHRLKACIQSNSQFVSLVVRNVPTEAFATYDDRPSKSFTDVLNDRGVKYASQIRTLITRIIRHESKAGYLSHYQPSNIEFDKYLGNNEWLKELVSSEAAMLIREPGRKGGMKLFKPVSATFALWMLTQVNKEKANEFFEKLILGRANYDKNEAIMELRNFQSNELRKIEKDKKEKQSRKDELEEVVYIVKAWNYWIDETTDVNLINWSFNVEEKIPVPKIP